MAHPNEDLARDGFAAFARGDIEAVVRNGKVTDVWIHHTDQSSVDAFWS